MGCQRCNQPVSPSHAIEFQVGPAKLVLICPNHHYAIADLPPRRNPRPRPRHEGRGP